MRFNAVAHHAKPHRYGEQHLDIWGIRILVWNEPEMKIATL